MAEAEDQFEAEVLTTVENELKKTEEIVDHIQEQIQNMYDELDQLLAS